MHEGNPLYGFIRVLITQINHPRLNESISYPIRYFCLYLPHVEFRAHQRRKRRCLPYILLWINLNPRLSELDGYLNGCVGGPWCTFYTL